jgi:hypothetical protein
MGAPRGNTNALKHGLYAKRFTPLEVHGLSKMDFDDLRHEIAALRVVADRILELLAELPKLEGDPERTTTLAALINSYVNASTAIITAVRAHAILSGKDAGALEPIEAAIRRFAEAHEL